MKTEFYRVIKEIDLKKLTNEDVEELLQLFMVTKNDLIRNHITFIFADLHYDKAIPYILKKVNEKDTLGNNASLVYSLRSFDMKEHFIDLIRIICTHEYEPRLVAYDIITELVPFISVVTKEKALRILKRRQAKLEEMATDRGENGIFHFVEKTRNLLLSSIEGPLLKTSHKD